MVFCFHFRHGRALALVLHFELTFLIVGLEDGSLGFGLPVLEPQGFLVIFAILPSVVPPTP
jgi:hypothetical protein